jgi:hypothetical protein
MNSDNSMYTTINHYNTNFGIPALGVQSNGNQPVLLQHPLEVNTLSHNTQNNYPMVNNAYPKCDIIYVNESACYVSPPGSTAGTGEIIQSLSQ